jgi:hypothetical protein
MEAIHINMIAVLVAVVANFIFGFLWYTVLFGKVWAKEMGFDSSVKPPASTMVKGMVFSVIGNFFLAYVFAHNIAAWGFVPGSQELSPMANVLNSSIFTWLGFYLLIDLTAVAWENKSWKLFGINTSYHFLMLLVASVILVYMK